MRRLASIALLASSCSPVIRDLSDCDRVQGEMRVECGLCLAPNKAEGWLGTYEYRPDSSEGKRCVRVK